MGCGEWRARDRDRVKTSYSASSALLALAAVGTFAATLYLIG
jgi:hypothetical protein